jgi:hypothetical protein
MLEVERLKISLLGILGSLICIVIGCFFVAGTWGAYTEYKRVQDYSGKAVGHITNKHFQATADGSGKYYLDYWFIHTASTKINATRDISKQQWDALKVNDTLEIRFDPSNLNRNMPLYGGSPSLFYAFFMLILGAVFILFGGLRFYNSFHKRKPAN